LRGKLLKKDTNFNETGDKELDESKDLIPVGDVFPHHRSLFDIRCSWALYANLIVFIKSAVCSF
jgi:hypothetical protein